VTGLAHRANYQIYCKKKGKKQRFYLIEKSRFGEKKFFDFPESYFRTQQRIIVFERQNKFFLYLDSVRLALLSLPEGEILLDTKIPHLSLIKKICPARPGQFLFYKEKGHQNSFHLYQVQDKQLVLIKAKSLRGGVQLMEPTADGCFVYVANTQSQCITLINTQTFSVVKKWVLPYQILHLKAVDENQLIIALADPQNEGKQHVSLLRLSNAAREFQLFKPAKVAINSIDLSDDARHVAILFHDGNNNKSQIIALRKQEAVYSNDLPADLTDIRFQHNDTALYCYGSAACHRYNFFQVRPNDYPMIVPPQPSRRFDLAAL